MRIPVLLTAVLLLGGAASAAPGSGADAPKADASKATPAKAEATKPDAGADTDPTVALRTRLQQKFPNTRIQSIVPSPVAGLYEVSAEGDVMYVSADGKYLLDAQIMEIDTRTNVTEAKRSVERKKALASLDEKQMIVFAPAQYKYTLTVFTDVDCGYCRKLHSEMAAINKLGVRVRYLAFPRQGPGSESWAKMEEVWCAKDRKNAITRAKNDQAVPVEKNCTNPVKSQYELGERLGVRGTPAIFTDSGKQIGGYVPADQLLDVLKQKG